MADGQKGYDMTTVIAETVNRRGRMLVDGNLMTVQAVRANGSWGEVWTSECLDDDDIIDGIEFMEGYCWCEPKLAFGPQP